MTDSDMDYAELWLGAQKAHKAIFEAALRKDWITAMAEAERMRGYGTALSEWFEIAHLTRVGK